MAEKIRIIGRDPGLRFEIALGRPASRDRALAWGDVRLFLDGQPIWESESEQLRIEPKPLRWTWIELLEYLGKWWPWLCLEETYPIPGVNPLYPCYLQQEAEARWVDLPPESAEAEEMAVFRYHLRHDISSALNGCYLPSLLIKRQGRQFIVSSAALRESFFLPWDEVADTLTAVGEHLADFLKDSSDNRAQLAVTAWKNRMDRPHELLIGILSGLDDTERGELAGEREVVDFWEWNPEAPFQDTEVLAAARMSRGIIPSETQKLLLETIKRLSRQDTPELDGLSDSVSKAFEEIGKPFAQGYWLATWLRDRLGIPEDEPLDPVQFLEGWNVGLFEENLPDGTIDALAVWGPRHGPAVLVNCTEPAKPSHPHGKRTTLAHEICHLLIDRARALPLGEVLGGHVAEHAEKRARAFAAELLLPRKIAAAVFRQADSLQSAIERIRSDFQVSDELIAWQLRNASGITLNRQDVGILERITGK